MITVLFGTYDSRHAANRLLQADLVRAGVEVRVCHAPLWQETRDKDRDYFGPLSLLGLGGRWLRAALGLALRFRVAAPGADCVVVGFNGQLDVLLARLLAGSRRVVFVPLVTLTETLVEDRAVYRRAGLVARLLRAVDRLTLHAADRVVVDTGAHAAWMVRELGMDAARLRVCPLGAEEIFAAAGPGEGYAGNDAAAAGIGDGVVPREAPGEGDAGNDVSAPRPEGTAALVSVGEGGPGRAPGERLRVLAYASYLPLHGLDVVIEAARLLGPEAGLAFELVGRGPGYPSIARGARDLSHVRLTDWLPYGELIARIRSADVVLGIFGASVKTQIVVPNKVYQAAQIGRCVLTADTPAIREIFMPGESIEVCAPNATALAAALRRLAADVPHTAGVGAAACAAVAREAGPERRSARLRAILEET